jgi:hypothetical protein
MKTIWKYKLHEHTELYLPRGAKVLSVGAQNDLIYLWAEVDSLADLVARRFVVYGTGMRILVDSDQSLEFVGTVMIHGDRLVFHVYEVVKKVRLGSTEIAYQ